MRYLTTILCAICVVATAPAQQQSETWASPSNPMVGTFKVTGTGDDGQGNKSKVDGTAVAKMDVGGKWLTQDVTAKMGEMQTHGRLQVGYDETTKTFVSSWIDDMAPVILVAKGTKAGNVITLTSDEVEMMGQKMKFKIIYTQTSRDVHSEQVQMDMGQGFQTVLDLTFTRVKDR